MKVDTKNTKISPMDTKVTHYTVAPSNTTMQVSQYSHIVAHCSSLGETMEVHFNTLNITAQLGLDHVIPQGTTYRCFIYSV